jgi:hypothetical protein
VLDDEDVGVDAVVVVVAVVAGALAVEAVDAVVPLEELPQPASAKRPRTSVRTERLRIDPRGFEELFIMRSPPS